MSEKLSSQILARLRVDADNSSRPKERNGTLDRLESACNAISNGTARSVVKNGLPEAEIHFRRSPVKLIPPRIEDYVLAQRALEARSGRPITWTGPTATTIRKDKGLLEYVRTRDQEHFAASGLKVTKNADRLLDDIVDIELRSALRFALAKGRQSEFDLNRLKQGMRKLRPTIDIDALIAGRLDASNSNAATPALSANSPLSGINGQEALRACLLSVAKKLIDPNLLSQFGLELVADHGNVIDRRTRRELFNPEEVSMFRLIVEIK